ncbi:unnamed protein product [Rhizophagus irregularis]|uniref:Uncharacterized protein n=1 Tax=Rhizophagus irregularis TaxID=588596 RepID=A0A915Z333_9GLOM|nr:unnamed protein product [Rhizophagus irregularis]CAB5181460.1 unnamed protein product [Rhizophagus irregularis]CAB5358878.1 unnamed protein product [Rhizophagus irregularis]
MEVFPLLVWLIFKDLDLEIVFNIMLQESDYQIYHLSPELGALQWFNLSYPSKRQTLHGFVLNIATISLILPETIPGYIIRGTPKRVSLNQFYTNPFLSRICISLIK